MAPTRISTLRIGTRGSPLALTQTDILIATLRPIYPDLKIEVVTIHTSGDWKPSDGEVRLPENKGGKGQFAKEIEEALFAGRIDCGVHSLKDMPAHLPEGLVIKHVLPAEDSRDVFISAKYKSWQELPPGGTIGTTSLRRQAFLLAKRPDLTVTTLRGNVATRLEKVKSGQVDGTFLALAGLKRLGLEGEATQILEPEDFMPACGQGTIAIEMRSGNQHLSDLLDAVHDRVTGLRTVAERTVLAILNGSCHSPIGVYATLKNGKMAVRAMVAAPDGSVFYDERSEALVMTEPQAEALGKIVGDRLKARVPSALLEG